MPDFVEPENLPKAKTLICKTQNANLKRNIFLKKRPQRFNEAPA